VTGERGGIYMGTVVGVVVIVLAFIGLLAVCSDDGDGQHVRVDRTSLVTPLPVPPEVIIPPTVIAHPDPFPVPKAVTTPRRRLPQTSLYTPAEDAQHRADLCAARQVFCDPRAWPS
jgi:hypothetical protein